MFKVMSLLKSILCCITALVNKKLKRASKKLRELKKPLPKYLVSGYAIWLKQIRD